MHLLFDQIGWGNPSLEDQNNIQVTNYLDDLLPTLKQQGPFQNSSQATREELQQLIAYSEYQSESKRRKLFDGELVPYINQLFIRNGCDKAHVEETTSEIVMDVLPIITKLKFFFQRPRPQQLAYYYRLPFFPNFSHFVSSPSYPSGHSVLAAVLTEVLSWHYAAVFPDCFAVMRHFSGEVMESRLYMGVHYPSDNRFALKVAQSILDHPGFKDKYEID